MVRLPGSAAESTPPEDFITGFLDGGKVHGRPVDVLSFGRNAFLLTDDNAGVVYYVYGSSRPGAQASLPAPERRHLAGPESRK